MFKTLFCTLAGFATVAHGRPALEKPNIIMLFVDGAQRSLFVDTLCRGRFAAGNLPASLKSRYVREYGGNGCISRYT